MEQLDLDLLQWIVLGISAMIIGIAKAGVPGIGILVPILLVLALPNHAAASVGLGLPMLIFGDMFALSYHRRHADWRSVGRALPWGIVGVLLGFGMLLVFRKADIDLNLFLKKSIGIICIGVICMTVWLGRQKQKNEEIKIQWWLAPFLGLLGGVMTMLANAAGPIFTCYLLALALPKKNFMGTSAWLFFILNNIKVPFHIYLGTITVSSFMFNLKLIPAIGVGALLGILLFKIIPERRFKLLVYVLTVAACIKLLLPSWGRSKPPMQPKAPPVQTKPAD